jgi:hypothetical protein
VVNLKSLPLYRQGESLRYPMDRRMGHPQNQTRRYIVGKNLAMPGGNINIHNRQEKKYSKIAVLKKCQRINVEEL